jgi:hypothetical protein
MGREVEGWRFLNIDLILAKIYEKTLQNTSSSARYSLLPERAILGFYRTKLSIFRRDIRLESLITILFQAC